MNPATPNFATKPLMVSREGVEPIHRRLAERGAALGMQDTRPAQYLTDDPDLHLVTDRGNVLHCTRVVGDRHVFTVPAGTKSVRIMSRTASPAETIGPFIDDRRDLGVLVGDAVIWEGSQHRTIDGHLNDRQLSGWSVIENEPCRWTTGAAMLSLGTHPTRTQAVLGLRILAAGPYLVAHCDDLRDAA